MDKGRLIDRVRQMRENESEEIADLMEERCVAVATIDEAQAELEDIDREIATKKQIIAEYQELIRRLEA
jgi:hypothetical protein